MLPSYFGPASNNFHAPAIHTPDLFVTLDSNMPHSTTSPSAATVTLQGRQQGEKIKNNVTVAHKIPRCATQWNLSLPRTRNTPVYPYICAESYATAPALGHHRTRTVRRCLAGSWYTGRRTRLGRVQRDGRDIRIGQCGDQACSQVTVLPAHHPHTGPFCI